jgi:hypothetical protein
MAENADTPIELFLTLLDKNIEAERNVREMAEDHLARMVKLLERPK